MRASAAAARGAPAAAASLAGDQLQVDPGASGAGVGPVGEQLQVDVGAGGADHQLVLTTVADRARRAAGASVEPAGDQPLPEMGALAPTASSCAPRCWAARRFCWATGNVVLFSGLPTSKAYTLRAEVATVNAIQDPTFSAIYEKTNDNQRKGPMQEIYQHLYKPMRNRLAKVNLESALAAIWEYSNHLENDRSLPEILRPTHGSVREYFQLWQLVALGREVIMHCARVGGGAFTYRTFADAMNSITEITEALSSAPTDADVWDPLESTCRHASLSIL